MFCGSMFLISETLIFITSTSFSDSLPAARDMPIVRKERYVVIGRHFMLSILVRLLYSVIVMPTNGSQSHVKKEEKMADATT